MNGTELRRAYRLTSDLSSLLQLGYCVPDALLRAAGRSGSPAASLRRAQRSCQQGTPLGAALGKEGLLPPSCVRLLDGPSGEALPLCLNRLARALEHARQRCGSIQLMLAYPRFLVSAGVLLMWLVLGCAGSSFEALFQGSNLKLPLPTQLMLTFRHLLISWPGLIGTGVVWIAFMVILSGLAGTAGLRARLPLVGSWIRRTDQVTLLEWLDANLSRGMSLPDAVRGAAEACYDPAYQARSRACADLLDKGSSLSSAAARADLFDSTGLWLLQLAEQQALSPTALGRASSVLRRELTLDDGKQLVSVEWLLLLSVGVVIGFAVLSFMLPLYQLIGNLG